VLGLIIAIIFVMASFALFGLWIQNKELYDLDQKIELNKMNQTLRNDLTYMLIVGPECGRDRTGAFHCACGKCRPLPGASEDRRCCPYYCRECRYSRDYDGD
jgi:hypothetical protein